MPTVLVDGRKLPRQDWEGDDFTPGAGGHYVTCTDTSAGRAVSYATNGRIDKDGKVYRAAIIPHDPNGVTLPQAKQAARDVADVSLIIPQGWHWANALAHLRAKRGLILQGWYAEIPRMYRYQLGAEFGHAMWASHYSPTSGVRVWDPLDPNTSHHGQWIPAPYVRNFLERLAHEVNSSDLFVGYVPLQHL
jgi:hypothetical protein